MILESIMNFDAGKMVKINPDNHGYEKMGYYDKVKDRLGRIREVEMESKMHHGKAVYAPTGRMSVKWGGDSTPRIVDYRRLVIVDI